MLFVDFEKKIANARVPERATDGAAGYDLIAVTGTLLQYNMVEYDTGIAVAIPDGYVGLLFPRSSVSKTNWSMANSVGVIDSDYRGSIRMRFRTGENRMSLPYKVGERIGQLVIVPCPTINFSEVESLSETDRGVGGFGHTGD
jgi:dUTP pyrophosphatase